MKLLHIADLHAGKTLGRVSRNPDLHYALEQIASSCREERAELLLIAGDVFDKANPDNESKELVFDFFLKLRDIGTEVVVVAGNHDSYDFMRSIKGLSRLANVHIYDRPNRNNCLFRFGDLEVACLPYPSERVLTAAGEGSRMRYADMVARFISYLAEQVGGRWSVLLTHLFVAGSRYTSTEKEASVTQHYAVQPASLPATFDYIALGHVHRHQRLKAAPTLAWYAGTLYQLDFSEAGEDKFFNVILLGEGDIHVEAVKLDLKNPLHTFELNQREVVSRLQELKNVRGYLRVLLKVEDKGSLPLAVEKLREELGDRLIRIEHVSPEVRDRTWDAPAGMDPLQLYREYHRISYGRDLPEEVEKVFSELLRKAEESV